MAFYAANAGSSRSYNKNRRASQTTPAYTPKHPVPGIKSYFQYVDKDKSGKINADELRSALTNGHWRPFNLDTCKLMIAMFDRDGDGVIDFNEFQALWDYIIDWTDCFKQVDHDRSGYIDRRELISALTDFGYRLSEDFYNQLVNKFSKNNSGRIYADNFIQMCVMLQTITAAFADKDTDRDGVITINYEEFLRLIFFHKVTVMTQPDAIAPPIRRASTSNYLEPGGSHYR